MLLYWLVYDDPDFHPSKLKVAPSPSGRAAPAGISTTAYLANLHPQAVAAGFWGFILSFILFVGLSAALIVFWGRLDFIPPVLRITAVFVLVNAFGVFLRLDSIFWKIRRCHDVGLPWPFALAPAAAVLSSAAAALTVGAIWGLFTGVSVFVGLLLCVALPIEIWSVVIDTRPGDPRPNRYGPPPTPLPQRWRA